MVRLMPLRISLPSTEACKFLISNISRFFLLALLSNGAPLLNGTFWNPCPSMQRFLRAGRTRISRTSQKVQSYLFIFFPSVDERLFSTIRPEMASPSSPENEYQVMAKFHPTRRPDANNMPLPSCHGPAVGMPPSRRTMNYYP